MCFSQIEAKGRLSSLNNIESPDGVKWGLGLACFCPGKMGLSHWDWDLLTGNWENRTEMGMG